MIITALVIPITMLLNWITTLAVATGSVVIAITSCVVGTLYTQKKMFCEITTILPPLTENTYV